MNGVGMYQNYMTSFQEMGQINHNGKKSENNRKSQESSPFDEPGAVYKRTSTDEDVRKAQAEQQKGVAKNPREEKTRKSSLENFTISKNNQEVKLSDKAQKLLEQLKEKYSNMDFFVANYSTDEEAQQYLRQGTKEYSVVIDPETLEKMAEDEETFQKYDNILSNAGNTFQQVKDQLGEDADKVANFGMNIDKDGKVTLFAELDKQSVKRIETQKKMREEKAAEKKTQKQKDTKEAEEKRQEELRTKGRDAWNHKEERLTFRVTGNSIEELAQAIKNAVWE